MDREKEILRLFPEEIRERLRMAGLDYGNIREIRLRAGRPVQIEGMNRRYYLSRSGQLTSQASQAYTAAREEVAEFMEYAGSYSLYAYGEELREGFLTVEGGHRVGVAGKVILEEGRVQGMKYITSVNLRISHEVKGCAAPLLPLLKEQGRFANTLVVSPPGCGKTTLLRDLIRLLASGGEEGGYTVGVADERGEIGGSYLGVPTKDLGTSCDVLDGCPKSQGMLMLLRSMAPQILAVDEVGRREDVEAIAYARCCGCRILATMHGDSLEELDRKPYCRDFRKDQMFDRYVFLEMGERPGQIREILDKEGRPVPCLE